MDIKEVILLEHSKANKDVIVNWIGADQKRFGKLFDLFLNGDTIISQRASWPLSYAVQSNPFLINPYLGKLLKNLSKPNLHDAVKRNTLRLLHEISIPKRFCGLIMNTCFDYIVSPMEKPAIKAFSLTILYNFSRQYPEIKNELKTIIESNWDNESPAYKSRARKILKKL
ncbi:MAG: hypothetical protein WBC06_08150 [Chitinophagaceae bacterium]